MSGGARGMAEGDALDRAAASHIVWPVPSHGNADGCPHEHCQSEQIPGAAFVIPWILWNICIRYQDSTHVLSMKLLPGEWGPMVP